MNELDGRSLHALRLIVGSDLVSPADVAALSEHQLLMHSGVGRGTVERIQRWLEAAGLSLRSGHEASIGSYAGQVAIEGEGLGGIARNALYREIRRRSVNPPAVLTREAVSGLTIKEIRDLPNVGKVALREIEHWLKDGGYALSLVHKSSQPFQIKAAITLLERNGYSVIKKQADS